MWFRTRRGGQGLHCLLLLFSLATALAAHDTWLVPLAVPLEERHFRVPPGSSVQVGLHTSEEFPLSEVATTPDRIARFEMQSPAGPSPVSGYRVEGQSLVSAVRTPAEPGEILLAAATHARLIVLEGNIFNDYLTAEGLEEILALRSQSGESTAPGRERYSKIAKLGLCVGTKPVEGGAARRPFGLRLEIVPLVSLCTLRVGDPLLVQVLFEGEPLAGLWVAAGYPGVEGHHYPYRQRTDGEGRVTIPLNRPGPWFVRTLHMVRDAEFEDADWQSWFSTLTFGVGE